MESDLLHMITSQDPLESSRINMSKTRVFSIQSMGSCSCTAGNAIPSHPCGRGGVERGKKSGQNILSYVIFINVCHSFEAEG